MLQAVCSSAGNKRQKKQKQNNFQVSHAHSSVIDKRTQHLRLVAFMSSYFFMTSFSLTRTHKHTLKYKQQIRVGQQATEVMFGHVIMQWGPIQCEGEEHALQIQRRYGTPMSTYERGG